MSGREKETLSDKCPVNRLIKSTQTTSTLAAEARSPPQGPGVLELLCVTVRCVYPRQVHNSRAAWGQLEGKLKRSPCEESAWSVEIMERSGWHPKLVYLGRAGFLLGGETVIVFSLTDKTFYRFPTPGKQLLPCAQYLNEGVQSLQLLPQPPPSGLLFNKTVLPL